MKSNLENNLEEAFTKPQARRLREAYSYLEGQELALNDRTGGRIETVAVAPYDEINKWIFMQYYQESRDCEKALDFYEAPYYDVILIISGEGEGKPFYTRAETYVACLENKQ
jgi:hypothetical protein